MFKRTYIIADFIIVSDVRRVIVFAIYLSCEPEKNSKIGGISFKFFKNLRPIMGTACG